MHSRVMKVFRYRSHQMKKDNQMEFKMREKNIERERDRDRAKMKAKNYLWNP